MRKSQLFVQTSLVIVTLSVLSCGSDNPMGVLETLSGTFRLGPITLSPGGVVEGSVTGIPHPPGDIGIRAINFEVVDEAGTPIPHEDLHLHHIVFHNGNRNDRACPGQTERFVAAGQEKTPVGPFPDTYAYPVAAGDRLDAIYHLMDTRMEGGGDLTVYIEYEMTWFAGASGYSPLVPYFLDVTGCGGNSTYDVPGDGGPGSEHVQSATLTSPINGTVVWIGGHLHEGGKRITLTNETTGELVCSCDAMYDEMGELHMSSCAPMEEMHEGDMFLLESIYDNSRPYEDVMGIVIAYIWENSGTGGSGDY